MGYTLDRDEYSRKLSNVIGDLIGHVLTTAGAKEATKYLSPNLVVSALYVGKPGRKTLRHHVNIHIGSPNYAERRFIKRAKKAREPFPVKKIQLKFPAKRKKK